MKKILIISIILIFNIISINYTNAADTKPIKVIVTEKIPGADCKIAKGSSEDSEFPSYECEITKGTAGVVGIIGNIIKWFAYLAGLVGALFIVYNGILYSMGGADQSLKDEAKKRIIGTLVGLILLFLSGPILQIIAPWIYK